ncbi:MAG: hypothetical protein M1453_00280 [Acidobacteria bacterium]|nr:hypothetical protein [Acidobacteriota bacterium]MCL5286424.1 hypothetical protein [Acidobacteriota bacterium]
MKRIATILTLLAACSLCSASLSAQSAESIVEKHIKARGGKKALQAIRSVRITGSVTSNPAGQPGEFLWQTRAPGSFYLETRIGDAHRVEACNGKSAWVEDTAGGLRTLTGREQSRARAAALYRNDRFLNYRKDKTKVQLLGHDTLAGRPVFVVEMTTQTGVQRKLFFDAESYLLLKDEAERDGRREEVFFGDYRAVGGVKEPYRISLRHGTETLDLAVHDVVHNSEVTTTMFDFPSRSARPLPDLGALLLSLVKNQKRIDEIREDYTYTSKETESEIDGRGNIKQKSAEEYEVFYVHGWRIKKLVRKNGMQLSESEQRKEQERVEKRIKEVEKLAKERDARVAKREAAAKKRGEAGADEDDDNFGISDFLRVCQLVHPRRERFSGREVIVFEFEPRPGYKARSRAESMAQKLVGVMWIDEDAQEVVRAEARTTEPIRIGGGLLASLGKGAEFVFEQERINNEIWLPRYAEVNMSARVLLVKGLKVHRTEQFSDYKKFRIETRQVIKLPDASKPPDM